MIPMDSILLYGKDEKLQNLFQKLGYALTAYDKNAESLPALSSSKIFDLIVLDLRVEKDGVDLCEFLRRHEPTKDLPIVVLCEDDSEIEKIGQSNLDKIECYKAPISLGTLASKVAVQLRLRKFAGAEDNLKSNLGEVNIALRDLNSRFQRDLEEARAIQLSLLPADLPSDPRIDLAVSYEPLEGVGGDWYFTSKRENGCISMQIADITGHGLAAAFIGSMTKLALSAANREKPDELLSEMNKLLAPQLPNGRFVTMMSVEYDCKTGVLEYARAGHPPALVLKRSLGRVAQIKGEGFPIGFFPDSEYTLGTETLEKDDILLMYTDGLSEAQNRSREVYGTEKLSQVLLKMPDNIESSEIASRILDDFEDFREERIVKDDITFLVMRRVG